MLQNSQIQTCFSNTSKDSKKHRPHTKILKKKPQNKKGYFISEFIVFFNQGLLLVGLV